MRKKAVITPLGMNRDLAMSKFEAKYSYENRNLRLITDRATSKLVMTNERGTKELMVSPIAHNDYTTFEIKGATLGTAVIDNHLVIFTHNENEKEEINNSSSNGEITTPDNENINSAQSNTYGTTNKSNPTPSETSLDSDTILAADGPNATTTTTTTTTTTSNTVPYDYDYIYRIDFDTDDPYRPIKGQILYRGHLGFDLAHPIETLIFYENKDLQKVYWTDGINQPRMINIMADTTPYNDKYFDFAQEISGHEKITITRLNGTNGHFPSGTVQYAFSYYRNYGQETHIASVSPIHFIADGDRGAYAPDEYVNCTFKLDIEGLRGDFDGIRIYSIIHTDNDTTAIYKRIVDAKLTNKATDGYCSISYADNNMTGEDIEATALLYLGAEDILCQTMAQKDNTLFIGNIDEQHKYVPYPARKAITEGTAFTHRGFENDKSLYLPAPWLNEGKYAWEPQLGMNGRQIRFFKYGETYRLGLQFQDRYGKWSEVILFHKISITNNLACHIIGQIAQTCSQRQHTLTAKTTKKKNTKTLHFLKIIFTTDNNAALATFFVLTQYVLNTVSKTIIFPHNIKKCPPSALSCTC